MQPPRAALTCPLLLVALLALSTVALGCGTDERDNVRERTQRYIESEQAVMRRAQPDFERANQAYIAYAKGELEADTAVEQVRQAERAIRNARNGVLVLDPPPNARRLHEILLRYLDMNVEFADETTRLVRYSPAAAGALAPLDRANRRLQERLAAAEGSEDQARVLELFARAVDSIAADLRELKPPAVLKAVHVDQVRRLEATRRLAGRLRRALRAQDAERVSLYLERFRRTAEAPSARRLLMDQAVARYSWRLTRLEAAYADVQEAQMKLARALR